jgi:hypothetical protein
MKANVLLSVVAASVGACPTGPHHSGDAEDVPGAGA